MLALVTIHSPPRDSSILSDTFMEYIINTPNATTPSPRRYGALGPLILLLSVENILGRIP